ncbi:hypothetical protein JCM33374_g1540 [Metschnikowia sp. JCM 33374]|nr:hypothetical protein JCM33374_g1540 [Metschnikowia sp. JCM 33374]
MYSPYAMLDVFHAESASDISGQSSVKYMDSLSAHHNVLFQEDGLETQHNGIGQDPIQNASSRLEKFIRCLKVFVKHNGFDANGFLSHLDVIQSELADIERPLQEVVISEELSSQLHFVKHFFYVMSISSYSIVIDVTCDPLIIHAAELRVLVLALLNSHGLPDFEVEQYFSKVSYLRKRLMLLQVEYKHFADVAPSVPVILFASLHESQGVLGSVASQLSTIRDSFV